MVDSVRTGVGQRERAVGAHDQGLLDINQLSAHLSIAKGTLYNWVYLRRIPFIKVGRCVRFDLNQVLDALASATIESAGKR